MPLVSVIIPTYQRAHLVGCAIQSVLAQSFTGYEIIVVNDGSTDHTAEVLAAFGSQISAIHQPNQGLAAARNAGIRAAKGEFIAFLDDDDLWLPHKLETQMAVFEQKPDAGLVYGDALFFDHTGDQCRTFAERYPPLPVQLPATLFLYNFIPVLTVMVRREALQAAGYFDETLRRCEDYDLWLRLIESWPVHGVKEPLAKFRLSDTNMQRDAEGMLRDILRVKEKAFERNTGIRRLPIKQLDRHFYTFYLSLASYYLKNREWRQVRPVLARYRRARGITMPYLRLCMASWLLPTVRLLQRETTQEMV